MGAVPRRPGPSLRALLFRRGERAVCEPWRLEDRSDSYSFLVGSESDVRQWGPWPAGPVRPSGPCCFGVASAPCVSLGGWKTGQTASFLVGSESDVRQWGPWPAGPVRPSVLFAYFPIFRSLWLRMGQHGPTWASRCANIGLKMGQHSHSPKMGQHSPKMGQHSPPKMGPHCPQDGPT